MADSVIELVLNELSGMVREEVDLQIGVKQEIEKVEKELKIMKTFLRSADVQKEKDPMLQSWAEEVRDVAFEIEDVVDEYLLRVAYGDGAHNTCLGRICSTFKKWKPKHEIGFELRNIKDKVQEIAERPKRYGYDPSSVNLYEQGSSSAKASLEIDQFRRSSAAWEDERQLVGIDETKKKLVDLLNDGDTNLKVLSIVGMGGLGKTALARKIYHDMSHFKRRAFATVSQSFKKQEFLKDIIEQLFPGEKLEMQQLPIYDLEKKLRERLGDESYLIVVDDVWRIKDWNEIKLLFPRNNLSSRVVVTTRITKVAKHSSNEYSGHFHALQPLSESDSWDLFRKNAFQTPDCPPHLEPICKKIVFEFLTDDSYPLIDEDQWKQTVDIGFSLDQGPAHQHIPQIGLDKLIDLS